MAGNDVFLWPVPSDANPNDVRLRDPSQSGAIPQDFLLGNSDPEIIASMDLDADDEQLSFYLGPLSDDGIIILDLIVNTQDEQESSDDLEYDFSFAPLADDAVLIVDYIQTSQDEAEYSEETDYDYIASPLSDDFIAAIDQIGQSFDDGDEETVEYDFFASPLSADFVVVSDIPYATFDEYDDAFEGDEYSFYLGVVSDDAPIVPVYEQDWSGNDGKKRKQQHEYAYDDYAKRKRELEAVIAKAIKTVDPETDTSEDVLEAIDNAPMAVLQTISNVVLEYRKLIQLKLDEDVAIAMLMLQ